MDYVKRVVFRHAGLARLTFFAAPELVPIDAVNSGRERSSHAPSDLIERSPGTEVIEPPKSEREYNAEDQAEGNDPFRCGLSSICLRCGGRSCVIKSLRHGDD